VNPFNVQVPRRRYSGLKVFGSFSVMQVQRPSAGPATLRLANAMPGKSFGGSDKYRRNIDEQPRRRRGGNTTTSRVVFARLSLSRTCRHVLTCLKALINRMGPSDFPGSCCG
jgi:hypothetical protein